MPIDDQMIVGAVLVLADAGLDQRRVFHRRKAEGEVIANRLHSGLAHRSFSGRRIEVWSSRVVGNLESATIRGWNAINKPVAIVGPDRQVRLRKAIVSGRCTEEKHILLRGANAGADGFREELA